jgi:predicted kinase
VAESLMHVSYVDQPNVLIKYRNPSLVLIAGVPGAGKTTLIERAIPDNAFLLSADAYRGRQQVLAGYPWDAYIKDAIPEARRKFMNDLRVLLDHRVTTFCDASYLTEHSQRDMYEYAAWFGIPTYLLVVTATLQECLSGVSNRERTVPRDKVASFYDSYLYMRDQIERQTWSVDLYSTTFITRRASESVCFEV